MLVQVKVRPNSRIQGVWTDGETYTVHVKDPPSEGKANRTMIRLLAGHLNVPESNLRIVRGFRSRTKTIEVL